MSIIYFERAIKRKKNEEIVIKNFTQVNAMKNYPLYKTTDFFN